MEPMSEQWVALYGRDHPELGELGSAGCPAGGGIALSRGSRPKTYPHVEPNEDGTLYFCNAAGELAAVADGHNGAYASEIALDEVRKWAPRLIESQADAFAAEIEALVDRLETRVAEVAPARTCLLLVAARGRLCHWANFGDSSLFRAAERDQLHPPNSLILGGPLGSWSMSKTPPWWGSFEREPGERVAALTDGVTNFIPNEGEIHKTLRAAEDDVSAAVRLCQRAMLGGAGDNVAAAVLGTYTASESHD
jgi:serine/threonine protein phosphatase PrpC